MIYDPKIECECDECQTTAEVSPPYKYTDYSGSNGHYDCSDEAVFELLAGQGWVYSDGVLFCNECKCRCKVS